MMEESDTNYYYNTTEEEGDDDDDEEMNFNLKKSPNDYKLWDSFQDPPVEESSGSSVDSKFINESIKLLKIFTYWFVLVVVACSSVLSKLSFLLMTSNVSEGIKTSYCDMKLPEKHLASTQSAELVVAWRWAIIIAFSVPELGTWIKSLRLCFFKKIRQFEWKEFIFVFIAESFFVIGLCLLAFVVLPELDAIQGVMVTNLTCFIPSILCMLSRPYKESKRAVKKILDSSSIAIQLLGLFVFPLTVPTTGFKIWLLPVAGFLISFHWWENFVTYCSPWEPIQYLAYIRDKCYKSRYKIYLVIAPYKIILFFILTLIITNTSLDSLFSNFFDNFTNHTVYIQELKPILSEKLPDLTEITSQLYSTKINIYSDVIWWTIAIQILSSYICYIFGKFACKIQIQIFSFSLPINISVPLTISALIVLTGLRHTDLCAFHDYLPDYIFFKVPPTEDFLFTFIVEEFSWMWVFWMFSQCWVTRHLWRPKGMRNASTEKLFILPIYDGLIIDQSMAMNRRRDEYEEFVDIETDLNSPSNQLYSDPLNTIDAKALANNLSKEGVTPQDHIPQIFVCATMWHETKEELIEFLKSILRLDEDQCARRMAMKYVQPNKNEIDKEYYDLETHIFFDDAFVGNRSLCESPEATPINSYVKLLINNVEEAAWEVYKVRMKIPPPVKIVCPYGGRLIWTLPGRTKMIAHLKDKNKIRHKKRWSQVMYMYYLLGYRIMQLDASAERKRIIAQNTFLLALDGDIDFQPRAMTLLIDRMKNDKDLGAACGRIHPIGKGPMVWYQVFEYAIGHWLQKSTEHVIGCVLCSPGCFSLFRGRALMENSVMRKYTTKSDQARHYIQYDQGEDRWLCTLVLKQKYRVEYCAASDAYTHAPEGFNEFYNQRRRWVPSTIMNIFDLLGDASKICKVNNNISRPYIFYQTILMFGTIIGPGTIFLMMVSAVQAVFLIDIYIAFLYNLMPLMIFMLICYVCKQKFQLLAAFIISVIYSLIMMAVMVGIMIQIIEDGIMSPSSMFFLAVTFQIVITGLLHPQEMYALPAGIVYYVTIPCMYMLLTIYSVLNMNDVSWGTRENPQEAGPKKDEKPIKSRNKFQKILGYFRTTTDDEEDGSIDISFAGLFRCIFCTHKKVDTTNSQLIQISGTLDELNTRIINLEQKITQEIQSEDDMERISDHEMLEEIPLMTEEKEDKKDLLPDWLYDPDLKDGDTETISAAEEQFWVDLIEKYLQPLDMTTKYKEQMQNQLKAYRDISAFAFTMSNALFVLIVFLLQLNKDYLHVRWPFDIENDISFDQSTFEFTIRREYKNLEPISMLFVGFFGIVLVVQFIAMLFHRFATISQILATTQIDWYFSKRVKDTISTSELKKNSVEIARHLQRPRPEWEDDEEYEPITHRKGRRDTIHKLLLQHKKQKDQSNLETNFKREFFKDGDLKIKKLNLSRKTTQILDVMRRSMTEFKKPVGIAPYPYMTSNDSCYSLAASDRDSFTIYQRSSYLPSSRLSVLSAEYGSLRPQFPLSDSMNSLDNTDLTRRRKISDPNAPRLSQTSTSRLLMPLKSAMKKSKTEPAIQGVNFLNGIDNLSFVNDEGEMEMKELRNGNQMRSMQNLSDIGEEDRDGVGNFETSDGSLSSDDEHQAIEIKIHDKMDDEKI